VYLDDLAVSVPVALVAALDREFVPDDSLHDSPSPLKCVPDLLPGFTLV
jgi:hypothetical protein